MKRLHTHIFIALLLVMTYGGHVNNPVYAQDDSYETVSTEDVDGENQDQAKDLVEVDQDEYILPYPGILPDHPLYFLKQLRDNILDFLIVDSYRKVEFYVLQADKRLNMALFLYEKDEASELASKTIFDASAYLEKALTQLSSLNADNDGYQGVVDIFSRSVVKHIEMYQLKKEEVENGDEMLDKAIENITKIQDAFSSLQ